KLMQRGLRSMRARADALIINVSSLASRLPVPFMAAYNYAKAALAAFTMSLQLELAHSPLHIVDLQPADISTEFNQRVRKPNKTDRYEARITNTWEIVERNTKKPPSPDPAAGPVLK